jgi:hypothetical protein
MMKKVFFSAVLVACSLTAQAQGVRVITLIEPADGAIVTSPVNVKFEVKGMKVAPAGTADANTGHHHLLINNDALPKGEEVPFDKTHLHFGKGQTETSVTLPPGKYKITAQFADGEHRSYGPAYSHTISITVK